MTTDWDGPLGVICQALCDVQALVDDDASDALARIKVVVEAPELIEAMHAIGAFPARNVPGADFT